MNVRKANDGPLLVTTQEASEILGVSVWTVRNLVREGKLRGVSWSPKSRKHFVTSASLARFLGEIGA